MKAILRAIRKTFNVWCCALFAWLFILMGFALLILALPPGMGDYAVFDFIAMTFSWICGGIMISAALYKPEPPKMPPPPRFFTLDENGNTILTEQNIPSDPRPNDTEFFR